MSDAIYIIIGLVALVAIFVFFGRKKDTDMGTPAPADVNDPAPATPADPDVVEESQTKP